MNNIQPDKMGNVDSKNSKNSDKYITCFVDGSHCPNSKSWGIAIWIRFAGDLPKTYIFQGNDIKRSSDVEFMGLSKVVDILVNNYTIQEKVIIIQSDCLSALNSIDTKILNKKGATFVKLKHVRAHTSTRTKRTKVNALVDRLAKEAMKTVRGY